MAHSLRLAPDTVNAEADATGMALDGGFLRIYGGNQPDACTDPVTSQPLLHECRFGNPACKLANDGRSPANPLTVAETRAKGKATWFRCVKADGTTPVMDGSVGRKPMPGEKVAEPFDLLLPTTEIVPGMEVHVENFIYNRRMR